MAPTSRKPIPRQHRPAAAPSCGDVELGGTYALRLGVARLVHPWRDERNLLPESGSQIRTAPSAPADAILLPDLSKLSEFTWSAWPLVSLSWYGVPLLNI